MSRVRAPSPKYSTNGCPGEVYFVAARELGVIKIGTANNTASRLRQLATACPDRIDLLGIIFSTEARDLEQRLHRMFCRHRSHGEWFIRHSEIEAYLNQHRLPQSDPRVVACEAAIAAIELRAEPWREFQARAQEAARANQTRTEVGRPPIF